MRARPQGRKIYRPLYSGHLAFIRFLDEAELGQGVLQLKNKFKNFFLPSTIIGVTFAHGINLDGTETNRKKESEDHL